jgi:predicted outer membrane repeat protein
MFRKSRRSAGCHFLLISIFVLTMLGLKPVKSAEAAMLLVTTINDSGSGSLRQAIASAAGGDTIKFSPSLAGQTISLTSTITLSKSITIDGTGLNPRVEISGGNAVRIFLVKANTAFTPAIKNLVLKEGKQTGLSYTYFGGALFVDGNATLTIDNVLIRNNSADTAGAIYISPYAVVNIWNSEITGNAADKTGGAIYIQSIGILNLRNSVVSNNIAGSSGTLYFSGATNSSVIENNLFENNFATAGGAILGELGNARIEIRNNLFSGNHATTTAGGAIYFHASTIPTLIILENNTFYNNVAVGSGGGAYLDAAADYYLLNNTFSGNMAGSGGNLYLGHGAGASRMYNNILANAAGGGDCLAFYNSYINGSNNLIEDGFADCHPTFTGDPGLLPLADNGGPTLTMALPSNSSLINAGNNSFCPSTDQRGTPRPQGIACDLGAVELEQTAPTVLSTKPGEGAVFIADSPTALQITFSEPMNQYSAEGRVDDPSNYLLINDNGNGFQSTSCLAGVAAQDQSISIGGISYNEATRTGSLTVNSGNVLPVGNYRLFICGTSPSLKDVAGNLLNNGSFDTFLSFRVIAISGNSVPENGPAGTSVFTLTAPGESNFSYSLDASEPSCSGVDNGWFSFSSNQLVTTAAFNYESKMLYTICVLFGEPSANSFHQQLSVYVTDINEPPLDVVISKATVNENSPVPTQVGSFSTQDPDLYSTFSYSLIDNVPSCDGADNSSFTMLGNALKTNAIFDYETKSTYSICVHSTDNGGLGIDKHINITVLDTNDAPSNIILTPSSILENQPGNTLVGYLIAIDPDGPTTTSFSSVPGKAGCPATGFNWFVLVNGNEIRALAPLSYDTANSYTLCIKAADSLGAILEKQVVITVTSEALPRVISITRANANPTNANTVNFTVTFSRPVVGVNINDFTLTTTGIITASVAGVSGSNNLYTVMVNVGPGKGTVRVNVVDDDSIRDENNIPLGGMGINNGNFTSGERYNIVSGAATAGVFRPGNGLLYLKNANDTGFADMALNYGLPGDYPVVGDWDGNGTVTIGIYRNGYFYLRNSNTLGFAEEVFPFGKIGDQPIAGDWNGDGIDTIGTFRPSTGQFLLRNDNSEGPVEKSFYLGNVGDVGIAGDWDGDGLDTTGVFRPSNGLLYLKNNNEDGFADLALNYGLPGDRPVTGDWDDDGIDTIGVYRNGQFMLRNSNTIGFAEIIFGVGNPGDMPIAGNWDGQP